VACQVCHTSDPAHCPPRQGRCDDVLACLHRGIAHYEAVMRENVMEFYSGCDYSYHRNLWLEARKDLDYLKAIRDSTHPKPLKG